MARILAPIRLAGGREVVRAERKMFAIREITANEVCRYIGNQRGRSGRARLIGHDTKLVPLPGEAQDRLEEIAAMRANDPTRPKNQVLRKGLSNRNFAFTLSRTVDRLRIDRRIFVVRHHSDAFEYIIGRVVNERHIPGRPPIEPSPQVLLH